MRFIPVQTQSSLNNFRASSFIWETFTYFISLSGAILCVSDIYVLCLCIMYVLCIMFMFMYLRIWYRNAINLKPCLIELMISLNIFFKCNTRNINKDVSLHNLFSKDSSFQLITIIRTTDVFHIHHSFLQMLTSILSIVSNSR